MKSDSTLKIRKMKDYRQCAYSEIIINNDKDRIDTLNLYNYFYMHKNEPYKEFMLSISKELNKEIDKDYILKKIAYIKKNISQRKAEEMLDILKLSVYLAKNDEKNIKIIQEKIIKTEDVNKSLSKVVNRPFYVNKNDKINEKHTNSINRLKKSIEKVINGEDVSKEEITKNNKTIKHNFKELNPDMYIDYIIKVYNLVPLKKEEIDHLIETIDFFIKNIRKNLEYLRSLDPKKNEEEIDKFYVKGENDLGNSFKQKKISIYNWKVSELVNNLDLYIKYRSMLESIKNENDFSKIIDFTEKEKRIIKRDYDFIEEYYNQINEINKRKEIYVDTLITIDSKKEEYNKKFINKIIEK